MAIYTQRPTMLSRVTAKTSGMFLRHTVLLLLLLLLVIIIIIFFAFNPWNYTPKRIRIIIITVMMMMTTMMILYNSLKLFVNIYRVAQKSKLLSQYNSLLFLSHPVCVYLHVTTTYSTGLEMGMHSNVRLSTNVRVISTPDVTSNPCRYSQRSIVETHPCDQSLGV